MEGDRELNNKIQKAAKKFAAHTLKGDINIETLVSYLHNQGYSVVFYNNESSHSMIIANNLVEYSKEVNGFTFCRYGDKFVFIKDELTDSHKLYTLLHETGHIILGHLRSDRFPQNDRLDEMEAEAFAYAVLAYKQNGNAFTAILVTLVIALFVSVPVYNNINTPQVVDSKTVYITGSGEKYHRKSCICIKNKTCTAVLRFEAEKQFQPCSLCNP